MSAQYAVVLADIRSGLIAGELPIDSVKATHALNAPGSMSCSMPLDVSSPITEADIDPARAALYLLRDDVCLWGGILRTHDMDVKANSLNLNATGWHEYFRHRFLKVDRSYNGVDQALIAQDLITWAQAQSGGNIGVTTDLVQATGITRVRPWFGYERQNVGKLIENLAACQNGFHFRYRSRRDGDRFTTDLITSYPATGRQTNIVLELGSNVELLGMSTDGTSVTNNAEAIGAGQTTAAPVVAAVDSNALSTSPLWESVDTYSDVAETATLNEKAQRTLTLGRTATKIPKVRLGPDVEPIIGSYECGDRVRIRGEYGLFSVDADFVITQIALEASTSNESVSLSVAPVAQFDS